MWVSCNSISVRTFIVLQLPHQTIFRTVSHTNITLTNVFPFVALLLQPTQTTAVLCKKVWNCNSGLLGWYQNKSWVGSHVKFINFLEIYNHSKSLDSFEYSVKQLCISLNLSEKNGLKKIMFHLTCWSFDFSKFICLFSFVSELVNLSKLDLFLSITQIFDRKL